MNIVPDWQRCLVGLAFKRDTMYVVKSKTRAHDEFLPAVPDLVVAYFGGKHSHLEVVSVGIRLEI